MDNDVYILYFVYLLIYAALLSDKQISDILNLARKYYRSWKSIGAKLGITNDALNAIENNHINDHSRLIAMIELWHVSVDLKPSQEAMAEALQSEEITETAATGINLETQN